MLFLLCCLLTFSLDIAGLVGISLACLEVRFPRLTLISSPLLFQNLESYLSPSLKCWVPLNDSRRFLEYTDEAMYK